MDADELLARHGEHPKRIGVPKIVLARERKAREVVDRGDIARLDVRQALAIERNSLSDVADEGAKPVRLQVAQLLARQRLQLGLEDHPPILVR